MSDAAIIEAPTGPKSIGLRRCAFTRDRFLRRIGIDIRALLGADRIQRLALYGSRARGDAREDGVIDDSDWDIAIFVNGGVPTRDEKERLNRWAHELWQESGWDVSPKLFVENGWKQRTIFMHNLRFDLIDL